MNETESQLVTTIQRLSIDVATLTAAVAALKETVEHQVSFDSFDAIKARVGALEAWQAWALRLIAGAVILALLGLVVTKGSN